MKRSVVRIQKTSMIETILITLPSLHHHNLTVHKWYENADPSLCCVRFW